MDCDYKEAGDKFVCEYCGDARPQPVRRNCPALASGLGTTIANGLKAVGVKPCGGCKKRQAALNRLLPYK